MKVPYVLVLANLLGFFLEKILVLFPIKLFRNSFHAMAFLCCFDGLDPSLRIINPLLYLVNVGDVLMSTLLFLGWEIS